MAGAPYQILLLGGADRIPGLRDCLDASNSRIEVQAADEERAHPSDPAMPRPDVVVIGALREQPLATAEQYSRRSPRPEIVFLLPPDRLDRLRAALPFVPFLGGAWTTNADGSAAATAAVIQEAAEASRRRNALASSFERINRQLSTAAESAERDRRQRQLAQSERYLATLLTHAPDAILAVDLDGAVIAWNDAAVRLFGLVRDQAIGQPLASFFPFRVRSEIVGLFARIRLGDAIAHHETLILGPDRREVHVELSLAAVQEDGGAVTSLSATVRDISERKQAEEALRQSEEQFRSLANSIPQLAWMARSDGWIYWFNRRWYEYTGTTPEQMEGWSWQSAHDPKELPAVLDRWRASIESGASFDMVFPLRGADGVFRPFLTRAEPLRDSAGYVVRWFGTSTDISAQRAAEDTLRRLNEILEHRVAAEIGERMKVEEALRQAQKMEAIGQLTGGVAHDFNNLLQAILGNLDGLRRGGSGLGEDRFQRFVTGAIRASERAAMLTQRLLAFGRRQPLKPTPIDTNKLVAGMSDLVRHTLGEAIRIETVLSGGLWRIAVDPNQLESALVNLAVNARDAMPDGGKLTIETANAYLDDAYAAAHQEVEAGQYVMVAVSDTGTGMSKNVIAKAFDPFFTTKDIGHGTGLGLSQVYGFVKQSGGHVKIYSELGEGTTVKLYLPRLLTSEAEAEPRTGVEKIPTGSKSEVILLVEDDEDVRENTAEMLRELGYSVLTAPEGRTALQVLEDNADIRLLFTDVGLPGGMNGRQLADEARRRRPALHILFTTGYARNAIVHQGRVDTGVELIVKPFTYENLAAKIKRALES